MIILQEGKLPPKDPVYYRGSCNYCKCIVRCREDDPLIIRVNHSVMCPTRGCFHVIFLSQDRPESKPECLKSIVDEYFSLPPVKKSWWRTPKDAFEDVFPSDPPKRKVYDKFLGQSIPDP